MMQSDMPLCPECGHIMVNDPLLPVGDSTATPSGKTKCLNCGYLETFEIKWEPGEARIVMLVPCPGGCGGEAPDDGEPCRACLIGAQVLNRQTIERLQAPIPMIIHCPACRARHIDTGEFATKPHHTHSCQTCGITWRPAVVHTVGVRFLPGFKDPE